jgi:hypothetical protein
VDFDEADKILSIKIDFKRGSHFQLIVTAGEHPVHDTVIRRYRDLNFLQQEWSLHVPVPRVKLPDCSARQGEPEWAGKLPGFTLLFEALVPMLAEQIPFHGVACMTGLSVHRVMAICER